MHLKRLEVSGFKSFPHKSVLEFPRGVTSVVGPNGSGKSNIADALRWVLGEQSMLRLRSKKGEDLIFNGSGAKGRLSKASVTLAFDNSDHHLPYEFSEVSISRKIYRDGTNQYYINGSEVRLRDVVELIAKAKLGLKGYTIINQGMADVILNASPLERKEIFEEALGLKEYQLKKKEALDKLGQTNANLKQAYVLMKEIEPHLKFLKKQVAKIEKRDEFLVQLRSLEKSYFIAQYGSIVEQKKTISQTLQELQEGIKKSRQEFNRIAETIQKQEVQWSVQSKDHSLHDAKVFELEVKQMDVSKELGKIEGLLEAGVAHTKAKPVNKEKLKGIILEVRGMIVGYEGKSPEMLKEVLRGIDERMGMISAELEHEHPVKEYSDLEHKRDELRRQLSAIQAEIKSAKELYRSDVAADSVQRSEFAKLHSDLRSKEHEITQLETKHHRLSLEHEQLLVKEGELKEFFGERFDSLSKEYSSHSLTERNDKIEDMKKDIERLRVRLEVTFEIDPETEKEYSKLNERYEFLTKQSGDLETSIADLQGIIRDLEGKIEALFTEAFGKISESFHHYFTILFNGGKAGLSLIKESKRSIEELEGNEEEKNVQAGGVDVRVELPGKKIKGLQMLSGGERALTSVALLLALVSTSPPPFMVLDEVDASLDEANSQRFARILQELKKNTQFVIVTHNREIMKESDVLYGITMEEEGISKLLSIELTKAEQYASK